MSRYILTALALLLASCADGMNDAADIPPDAVLDAESTLEPSTAAPVAETVCTDEICDGIDNDCDGAIDEGLPWVSWFLDSDRDGHGLWWDYIYVCSDEVQPGRTVVANDFDCNDDSSAVHPDQPEACDGIDNDCDGLADEEAGCGGMATDGDGDGFTPEMGDCNDTLADIRPDAAEVCDDGHDNDCDGLADENHDSSSCSS